MYIDDNAGSTVYTFEQNIYPMYNASFINTSRIYTTTIIMLVTRNMCSSIAYHLNFKTHNSKTLTSASPLQSGLVWAYCAM